MDGWMECHRHEVYTGGNQDRDYNTVYIGRGEHCELIWIWVGDVFIMITALDGWIDGGMEGWIFF